MPPSLPSLDAFGPGGAAVTGTATPLSGQGLRYALSLELLRAGELTVRALVEHLEAGGYQIIGRPSKAVSDALRWEVGHRRVVRTGHGRYATDRIPRSTVRWMQRALARWRDRWAAALAAGIPADDGVKLMPHPPETRPRLPWQAHPEPTGLTRYRRRRKRQQARALLLRALGVHPWRASLVPPNRAGAP